MTLAHGVHSGANCVAEPGQTCSIENRGTLPGTSAGTAESAGRPYVVSRISKDMDRNCAGNAKMPMSAGEQPAVEVTYGSGGVGFAVAPAR